MCLIVTYIAASQYTIYCINIFKIYNYYGMGETYGLIKGIINIFFTFICTRIVCFLLSYSNSHMGRSPWRIPEYILIKKTEINYGISGVHWIHLSPVNCSSLQRVSLFLRYPPNLMRI